MPPRYTDDFKQEAVKQVLNNNCTIKEVENLRMGKTIEGLIHLDIDALNFIALKVTKLES